MSKIIHKVLHWLGVAIATLVILLAVVLSLLHLLNPYLEHHHAELESLVSKFMQQSVHAGKIAIGRNGLEPVLQLRDVTIFNDAMTTELFKAREVRVGIDLVGSLLKGKIELGLLTVRGLKMAVYKDETGIRIGELTQQTASTSHLPVGLTYMLEWLSTQGSIRLSDVEVDWHDNGQKSTITNLELYLVNDVLQHNLTLSGEFMQKGLISPAKFNFKLGIKGNILKQEKIFIFGFAEMDDVILNFYHNAQSNFLQNILFDGDVELYLSHAQLNVEKVFRQSILMENFNGRVRWQRGNNGFIVQINNANLHSDRLTLNGNMQLILPSIGDAVIDSIINFDLTNIAQAHLFYPVNLLNHTVLNWLDQAFSGRKVSGTMILKGSLNNFPFDHGEGKFLITSNLKNINLDYAPFWPHIEDIDGQLIFEGRSMRVVVDSAKITGIPLQHIVAVIPDLDQAVLQVNGNVAAKANQGLHFVYTSPLRDLVGHELQAMDLSGLINLRLKLMVPLSEDEDTTKVDGSITFQNNDLKLPKSVLVLKKLQGILHFSENDFVAKEIKAELFGLPVMLNVDTQHGNIPVVNVNLQGKLLVADLRSVFALPFADQINGAANYQMQLQLYSGSQHKNDNLKITSNLQGTNIDLPVPFGKKFDVARDFSAALYFGNSNNPKLILNYDNFFIGTLDFKSKNLTLKITKFNWADWKTYLAQVDGIDSFKHIICDFDEFSALGMKFTSVKLDILSDAKRFLVKINSPKIVGELVIPHNFENNKITGTLDKLYLDKTKTTNSSVLKIQNIMPAHLQINDFYYEDKNFGKLLLEIVPQGNTILINHLDIDNQDFTLNAHGKWESLGGNHTTLQGKISSKDVGSAFTKFGWATNLVGGKGEASYDLSWNGTPDQMSLKMIRGNIALNIKHGRTTNLSKQAENEIGIVQILNLLSLPDLSRGLTLDFTNLTKSGFVFDVLKGDIKIEDGSIFTRNINLEGPVADIFIYGRIGVIVQDYDLNLIVVPHLTSSVPVLAAITGGPIVGLATFLGDKLLSSGTKKIMTYGYYVHGSWDKPNVDKLSMEQLAKVLRAK